MINRCIFPPVCLGVFKGFEPKLAARVYGNRPERRIGVGVTFLVPRKGHG